MSTRPPRTIHERNLSLLWGQALLHVYDTPSSRISPVVLSVSPIPESGLPEDSTIREALEDELHKSDCCSVAITAATIFPFRGWQPNLGWSRSEMYAWYLDELLPRLKKRDSRNNYGTYFERMIAFEGAKKVNGKTLVSRVNQLEQLISDWNRPRSQTRRPRHSALQVACFDPAKDLTGQSVRGFPCLQQVSFGYDNDGGLALSAYYPTQYMFDRAYGNYLGLCQLGKFVAAQLDLKFVRFNCFVAHPELGNVTKRRVSNLADVVRNRLSDAEGSTSDASPESSES